MPRKTLQGVVVSTACDKTVTVQVKRQIMHDVVKKFIQLHKKYLAHDPENKHKVGDTVTIEEVPPISKRKRWKVVY